MQRGTALSIGETYHIYNRGAHKRATFTNDEDYNRFLILLLASNSKRSFELRHLLKKHEGQHLDKIFEEFFDQDLVDVLAYCLMPNHFHLVLRQKSENGIEKFIQKLCTAYSMYFNTKYEHSGVLFQGRYQSVHIDNEAYYRYIFAYLHLNPIELLQSDWKEVGIKNSSRTRKFLSTYRYSSYIDYSNIVRRERTILAKDDIPDFLKQQNDLEDLLKWHTLP